MNFCDRRRGFAFGMVLAAACGACGATIYSEVQNFSQQTKMFTQGTLPAAVTPYAAGSYFWTDGQPPSAANDYVVSATTKTQGNPATGKSTPAGSAAALLTDDTHNTTTEDGRELLSFLGNSLTLKGNCSVYLYSPKQLRFENEGLILSSGAEIRARANDTGTGRVVLFSSDTKTRVTDSTSVGSSVQIRSTQKYGGFVTYRFLGPVKADAQQHIRQNPYSPSSGNFGTSRLEFVGDTSEFFGTVNVQGNSNVLQIASETFPGKAYMSTPSQLRLEGTCESVGSIAVNSSDVASTNVTLVIGPTNAVTVKDFAWGAGTLYFKCSTTNGMVNGTAQSCASYALLTVTDSFTKPAGTKIPLAVSSRDASVCCVPNVVPLLRVKKTAGTISRADFTDNIYGEGTILFSEDDTWQTVSIQWPVYHFNEGDEQVAPYGAYNSSFTNANAWTDGCVPHADADYAVPSGGSMRTPKDYDQPVTFGGRSLTFLNGSTFTVCTDPVMYNAWCTVPDCRFEGGSQWTFACRTGLTNSTLRVQNSKAGFPARISLNFDYTAGSSSRVALFDVTLVSGASDILRVVDSKATTRPCRAHLAWYGTGTDFLGTLNLCANVDFYVMKPGTLAGTVLCEGDGTTVDVTGGVTFGALTVGQNALLKCQMGTDANGDEVPGTLTVNGTFTFTTPFRVSAAFTRRTVRETHYDDLLVFPDAQNQVTLADFTLEDMSARVRESATLVSLGGGMKALRIARIASGMAVILR